MLRAHYPHSKLASCIGIEDGPFLSRRPGGSTAPLIVVKLEGPHLVAARTGWITVDGMDATERASKLLSTISLRDCPILLGGVTFGGFNLIDPGKLERKFRTPTVVVVGSRPSNRAVKRALVRHFPDWKERWEVVQSLGPLHRLRTVSGENPLYFENLGCTTSTARKILKSWALVSRVPEPLRVAGLVARGLFRSQPQN